MYSNIHLGEMGFTEQGLRHAGLVSKITSGILKELGEECGQAVNHIAAALILADKSDVHRGRVRN